MMKYSLRRTTEAVCFCLMITPVLVVLAFVPQRHPLGPFSQTRFMAQKQSGAESALSSSSSQNATQQLLAEEEDTGTAAAVTTPDPGAQFGDVVPMRRPSKSLTTTEEPIVSLQDDDEDVAVVKVQSMQRRNMAVAVASILLAASNYLWQLSHPITSVQLLAGMEQNSDPLTVIGRNHKPTLVDFWAPWCEDCKASAPTLLAVKEEYKDRVNFVLINGDKAENFDTVEAFGVDGIPHMAMVEADGTVETALIGPVPKHVLTRDLDVLIHNAATTKRLKQDLPYRMLDAFAGRPEARQVRFFEEKE